MISPPAQTSDDVFETGNSTPPPVPARMSTRMSSCGSSPSVPLQSQSSSEEVVTPSSLGSLRSSSRTLPPQPQPRPRSSKVSLPGSSSSVTNTESSANVVSPDVTNAESSSKLVPSVSATAEEKVNTLFRRPLSASAQNVKQQTPASVTSQDTTVRPLSIKSPDGGRPIPSSTKPSSRDSIFPVRDSPSEPAASEPTSTSAATESNNTPSNAAQPSLTVKERLKQFAK